MENVGYQEMKNMGYHGIEVSMEYYRVGAALWGNERWSAVRYTGTSCVIVRLPATQAPWTGPNPSPTLLASSHEGAPGQQCHGGPHRLQHPTGTQVCEWEWGSLGTQILTLHGDMGDTGWVCLNWLLGLCSEPSLCSSSWCPKPSLFTQVVPWPKAWWTSDAMWVMGDGLL